MIIDGAGLVASAFREWGDLSIPGLIFARGVADSSCADESAYARELSFLDRAIGQARDSDQPLVYFTGAPIYGSFADPVNEGTEPRPTTRYGRHQVQAEDVIQSSGVDFLALRLPNLVGPGGHPRQLVPSLVRQVLNGAVTVQRGAGRDLLDVSDAVRLVQRLLALGTRNMTINVASGVCTPVAEIVDEIARMLDRRPFIDEVEGGQAQRFEIALLNNLLGPANFDSSYPIRTLDRWVRVISAASNPG